MTLDEIKPLFRGVTSVRKDSFQCLCPAHKDKEPSLTVAAGARQPIILRCHAGCEPSEILEAVGLKEKDICSDNTKYELSPLEQVKKYYLEKQGLHYIDHYDWKDSNGKYLKTVFRFKKPDAAKKVIRQVQVLDKPIFNVKGIKTEIYNIQVLNDNKQIFFVEGEKCVEALRGKGIAAVTTGNCGSWRKNYTHYFKDKDVVILADNDEPGEKFASSIASDIKGTASSVVSLTTSKAKGGDVFDYFEEGFTVDDLYRLVESARCNTETNEEDIQAEYLFTNTRGNLSVNTSLLAEHIRQNNHYYIVKKQGSDSFFIYWYEDGYYKELSPNELKAKIKALIPLEIRKPSFWEDTYKDLVATDNFIGFEEMNNDERYINFRNGLLDTYTWELVEHDPKHRHIYQIQCNYNEQAAEPTVWKDFINTLAEGDIDIESTLQEWFGLNLSNYNANMCKKAVALYGPIGDTGKSKYLNVMSMLIGINNVCSKSIQDFAVRFGGGALYGKKCILIDDQKATNIEDGSTFKAVTGGGAIEAELKGKQPFSFVFNGGITFTCNAMPYIKDDKGSHMFERFLIIPCNNVVPKEKRDIKLLDKLTKEKEGIALWAIEGLKRLISNNFKLTVSERSILANEDYRKMNDTFFRFISENYTMTDDKKDMIPKKNLEEAYLRFCNDNNLTPLDKKNIPERAESNGIIYGKYQGYWYYRGLEEQLPF